ncbi:MAG: bifunctional adenosylcobinamide kinase/adenosylcobinamide-phosphate guanylyltransferase [Acidimicrobiia bacterium]|nr:bifunctional adenosylcobinamide kinase/adenosylcobinamide-phosphate guanylyltransferase [Acidimicrobiia bacterium]MDH5521957.1 bifunctional adenosylcobinamide kinase/adenosylcobinamide-phosphate guanylyltransferase [Acidimicrobiia bacterium]
MTETRSILLLGGVRSGKSSLAVTIGRGWDGPVTFVATAQAIDDDMTARIDRHRRERPEHWTVLEYPMPSADDLPGTAGGLIIVDCITVLVANLLFADPGDDAIVEHVSRLGEALADRAAVVVTNEVGMGVHPPTELGRRYRDLLGAANRALAASLDDTYLVMAGRAVRLDDGDDILHAMGVSR